MIDLHSHTLFSDGTLDPEALVRKASALELTALALTDHDTLAGMPRFLGMQPFTRVRLITGTELSCTFLGKSLHVMGLFVDAEDACFQARLEELRNRRQERNLKMIRKLNEQGVPITLELIQKHADSPLLSRIHFAWALRELGCIQDPEEAFPRYIGEDAPAYVPREELSPAEAARWIREAQGLPIVAHPGRFMGGRFVWDEAMAELKRMGMAGLEAYYGSHSQTEQEYFIRLARRLGMVISGGSDFHGDTKPGLELGRGWGSLRVPDELLDRLDEARKRGD